MSQGVGTISQSNDNRTQEKRANKTKAVIHWRVVGEEDMVQLFRQEECKSGQFIIEGSVSRCLSAT